MSVRVGSLSFHLVACGLVACSLHLFVIVSCFLIFLCRFCFRLVSFRVLTGSFHFDVVNVCFVSVSISFRFYSGRHGKEVVGARSPRAHAIGGGIHVRTNGV